MIQTWLRAERIKLKFRIYKKRSFIKYKIFIKHFEKFLVKQKMMSVMEKQKKYER